jgi:hypothetical protein
MILAGGVAAAAVATAAPAAAQYYPGYGYGYGGGGIGQILNQVLGGGGYGYQGYGVNQQAVVNQCAAAVQQRLSGGYGYNGYGYNGYAGVNGGQVLGISRVEPRSSGGLTVRGVATSGRYAGYGYGYAGQRPVDLTWKCKTDYRGFITDIAVSLAQRNYSNGYNSNYGYQQPYSPYDYSQYGYRRY